MSETGGIEGHRPALDFAELVGLLRDAGFSPDTRRYLSAHQLLLTLAEHGVDLGELATAADRARFVSHMAPVFCANAEEQARFAEIVDTWLGAQRPAPTTPSHERRADGARDGHLLARLRRWTVAHPWRVLSVTAGAGLLGAVVFGQVKQCERGSVPTPTPAVSAGATPAAVSASSFRVSGPTTIQLPALAPQTAVATDWAKVVGIGAMAAAVALFASWRAGRPSRQLALLRLPSATTHERGAFGLECQPLEPLSGPEVRRLVGSLRRPRELTDSGLDLVATASASANAAGLFTPVNRPRRRMPVYVALLSRRSAADHQTRLHDLLLDQLVRAGVTITRYYFDDDPRVCHHADASARAILLDELAVTEQDATLFLFAQAATCVDPISGELAPWVAKMAEWHRRVLFTPDAPYCWGAAEELLAASGFIVLPDGPQGLKTYGEVGGDWSIDQVAAPYARSYPSLLSVETRRWLDRHVPPPETRDKMLRQLRGYLGPHGFVWLAACAVYPEVSWPLTVRLADVLPSLFDDEPPREPLKNLLPMLARLPWLRHAYLPDWLRIALLRQLGPERERLVRDYAGTLLDDLKIVPRDALEIVPLRGKASPAENGESTGDAVYLGFMSGATLDPLGLLAPEHLRGVFRGLRDLPPVGAPPAPRTRWQRAVRQWRGNNVLAPTWRRLAVTMIIAMIVGAAAAGASAPFLSTVTSGPPGVYEDVAFRDGTPIVAARVGELVSLSEVNERRLSPPVSLQARGAVDVVALSRDGSWVVAVYDGGVDAFRWPETGSDPRPVRFEAPRTGITKVSLGKTIAAGIGAQGAGVWNLESGAFSALSVSQPVSVAVSANDDTIAVAHRGRTEYGGIALFARSGAAASDDAALPQGGRAVVSAVAVHDADVSAYGMEDGTVGLTRRESKDWVGLGTAPEQSFPSVTLLCFSADGNWLAAAGGNQILLWDLAGRSERALSAGDAPNAVFNQMRPPPNAVMQEQPAPSPVVALEANGAVRSLAFAPDGRSLVAVTSSALNVWELDRSNQERESPSSSYSFSTPTGQSTRVPDSTTPLAAQPPATVAAVPTATGQTYSPRVYLHVPTERDKKTLAASGLLDVLEQAGFEVPPIDVKPGPKDGIEIRYFRAEAGGAETLERVLKDDLGLAVRLQDLDTLAVKQETRPFHYEAWFAPGMADMVTKALYGRSQKKRK